MTAFSRFCLYDYINTALESRSTCQIGAALALGVILGLAALTLNPLLILGGIMGLILLVATFTHPEFVILIVLALVTDLVPARFNPPIGLPVGTFHPSDLLLILLLCVVIFRVFTDKTFPYVKTPLDTPVLLFFGAVLVAMGTSMFRFGMGFNLAQIEARVLMYYLIFFVVTNLIRTKVQLTRLVKGIFLIGLLVVGTTIMYASLGISISGFDESVARPGQMISFKFHPGLPAIYITLIALICDMALQSQNRFQWLRLLQILVLVIGFFLAFERSLMLAAAISLAVLVFILREPQLSRLAGNLLCTAFIAVGGAGILALSGLGPLLLKHSTAVLARITSIFTRTILTSQETIVSRIEEIRYAGANILRHPVFGIGLWNPYRPDFWEGDTTTRFVHNAYVSIWLKSGLLGLVPFLWLSVRFLRRGFQYWRDVRDDYLRAVTLGFTLAYLGMMINNLTAPYFVQDWSLAIFGVILGINELILMYNEAIDKHEEGVLHGPQHAATPS